MISDTKVIPVIRNSDVTEMLDYHGMSHLKLYHTIYEDNRYIEEIRFVKNVVCEMVTEDTKTYGYNFKCVGMKCDLTDSALKVYLYNDSRMYVYNDEHDNDTESCYTSCPKPDNSITVAYMDFKNISSISVDDFGTKLFVNLTNQEEPWIILDFEN